MWNGFHGVIALSLVVAVLASLPLLFINLNVRSAEYPASWKLILASIDAGVQEEIFSRLFLMTLLAWLGGFFWRDSDGYPSSAVMWGAVSLAGLVFGFSHIDDVAFVSENTARISAVFLASTLLGIIFGWLYWKHGLECAILAHFAVDAVYSVIIIPAYFFKSAWVYAVTICGLILVFTTARRLLWGKIPEF